MKRSTPMDRNIGAKVQYYRNQLNLTQKELAARLQVNGCDLSEVMVAQIEIGYRAVSVFEIDKLAEVLHVDYNALFAQDWAGQTLGKWPTGRRAISGGMAWPGGQAPQREFSGLPECSHYGNGLPIEGWAPQCPIERRAVLEGMGHG